MFLDTLIWLTASVICGLFVFWLCFLRDEEPARRYPAIGIALVAATLALVFWPSNWLASLIWRVLTLPFREPKLLIVAALIGAYVAFNWWELRRNQRRLRDYTYQVAEGD